MPPPARWPRWGRSSAVFAPPQGLQDSAAPNRGRYHGEVGTGASLRSLGKRGVPSLAPSPSNPCRPIAGRQWGRANAFQQELLSNRPPIFKVTLPRKPADVWFCNVDVNENASWCKWGEREHLGLACGAPFVCLLLTASSGTWSDGFCRMGGSLEGPGVSSRLCHRPVVRTWAGALGRRHRHGLGSRGVPA